MVPSLRYWRPASPLTGGLSSSSTARPFPASKQRNRIQASSAAPHCRCSTRLRHSRPAKRTLSCMFIARWVHCVRWLLDNSPFPCENRTMNLAVKFQHSRILRLDLHQYPRRTTAPVTIKMTTLAIQRQRCAHRSARPNGPGMQQPEPFWAPTGPNTLLSRAEGIICFAHEHYCGLSGRISFGSRFPWLCPGLRDYGPVGLVDSEVLPCKDLPSNSL